MRFSGAKTGYDTPACLVGEHTREVLNDELGLDDKELDALKRDGVI